MERRKSYALCAMKYREYSPNTGTNVWRKGYVFEGDGFPTYYDLRESADIRSPIIKKVSYAVVENNCPGSTRMSFGNVRRRSFGKRAMCKAFIYRKRRACRNFRKFGDYCTWHKNLNRVKRERRFSRKMYSYNH